MILIKNIRLIDPKSKTDKICDIYLEDGKIKEIGTININTTHKTIDGTGLVAAPGLVDIHVHFREPGFEYKEDILTGANAAAKGGFTTVVCMANTKPIIDNIDTLNLVNAKAGKAKINVLSCGAISKGFAGKELVDMQLLRDNGAVGFTDDGMPLMDKVFVLKAMEKAKNLDVPLSFHEEDISMIGIMGINDGEVSRAKGIKGAPRLAEETMIERDIQLAKQTGARVNFQHISSAGSVELIRKAKAEGISVWCEATPQHFSTTEEIIITQGTKGKVNPPLRTEKDRLAIIKGLRDGTIDFIATDHAPHSKEEKDREFSSAPSGMIGLETALCLGITYLVRPGYLSITQLIEKMTVNPSSFYKLDTGSIEIGKDADLVIFAEDEEYIITDDFVSKSSNSPFVGLSVYGKVKATIAKGKLVYEEDF